MGASSATRKEQAQCVDAKHIEESFRVKLKAFAIHHAEGLPCLGAVRKPRLQSSRSSRLRKPMRRNQNGNSVASRSINRFFLIPSRGASAIATMCALWRSRLA